MLDSVAWALSALGGGYHVIYINCAQLHVVRSPHKSRSIYS